VAVREERHRQRHRESQARYRARLRLRETERARAATEWAIENDCPADALNDPLPSCSCPVLSYLPGMYARSDAQRGTLDPWAAATAATLRLWCRAAHNSSCINVLTQHLFHIQDLLETAAPLLEVFRIHVNLHRPGT
jgi:hypothetical protein